MGFGCIFLIISWYFIDGKNIYIDKFEFREKVNRLIKFDWGIEICLCGLFLLILVVEDKFFLIYWGFLFF